jgi:hypothetical protein
MFPLDDRLTPSYSGPEVRLKEVVLSRHLRGWMGSNALVLSGYATYQASESTLLVRFMRYSGLGLRATRHASGAARCSRDCGPYSFSKFSSNPNASAIEPQIPEVRGAEGVAKEKRARSRVST